LSWLESERPLEDNFGGCGHRFGKRSVLDAKVSNEFAVVQLGEELERLGVDGGDSDGRGEK
jgi:hypothetical protein